MNPEEQRNMVAQAVRIGSEFRAARNRDLYETECEVFADWVLDRAAGLLRHNRVVKFLPYAKLAEFQDKFLKQVGTSPAYALKRAIEEISASTPLCPPDDIPPAVA